VEEAIHMLDTILKRIPGVTVAVRTLVVVALLGVAACAPVKRRTFEDSSTEYSYHTVMYSGETLSIIARWYTGQSGNWEVLLDHNGDLDPRRLQIGDLVKIPQELLIRDESMPKAFVDKANAKVAQKSVLSWRPVMRNPQCRARLLRLTLWWPRRRRSTERMLRRMPLP
jgi:hypothetical protein